MNAPPDHPALSIASLRRAVPGPVRDRLLAMLLLAALLHGIILLGVGFTAGPRQDAVPGMDVLLVSDELPDARSN